MQFKQKILPAHIFHRKNTRTWVVLEETKRNLFRRRHRICSCWYLGSNLRLVLNYAETYKPSYCNMAHLLPSTLTSLTAKVGPLSNSTCSLLFRVVLDKERRQLRRITVANPWSLGKLHGGWRLNKRNCWVKMRQRNKFLSLTSHPKAYPCNLIGHSP